RFPRRNGMFWIYFMRIILSIEGITGATLNMVLLLSLYFTKSGPSDPAYRVPLYVFGFFGFLVSSSIAFMNFTHIFIDDTFVVFLIGFLEHSCGMEAHRLLDRVDVRIVHVDSDSFNDNAPAHGALQ
ncbi:hypothetical protein PMAYCL1PPCAC_15799, partial [Pristionchus mayeri]